MKNWLKKNILNICMVLPFFFDVYHIDVFSHFFFGEPEFPVEE